MYFQRGRKEVSVERICDKNRVTEGDVYRTGEREDSILGRLFGGKHDQIKHNDKG